MNAGLDGVRVVVTRAREQSASLIDALEQEAAEAVPIPVIDIVDPPDGGAALTDHVAALADGDWLVVTSPNGASKVGAVVASHPLAAGVSVAAIGPGTRARAEAVGLVVDLTPEASIAEGLLDALPAATRPGAVMLLARAESAREVLPEGLAERGWVVHDVAAYRTVGLEVDAVEAERCRQADVVAFTSASTVRHLVAAVGAEKLPPLIACIGPATSAEAERLGLEAHIVASVHTIPGLVAALVDGLRDEVRLRAEDAGAPSSQWMLEQYYAEIDQRFVEGLDRATVQTTDVHEISPPNGVFIAARLGVEPVGCGVVKVTEPGVADIKRMWVSDRVRGRGVGRRLLRRLVAEGRALGLRQVRLETNEVLTEAIALYRSEGFVEVDAFNAEPHAHHWFVLDLD